MPMFAWLEKWILERFLKQLLDYLPMNGKKTVLGVLILVLVAVLEFFGPGWQLGPLLQALIEWLKTLGATDFTTAGWAVVVLGVCHKILKRIFGEPASKAP